MLHERGLANKRQREGRQGSRAGMEPELRMRERSKVSADCRDEHSLGSGRKRDCQPILPHIRYTLVPLWSLHTGGAGPLLLETNRVLIPDSRGLPSLQASPSPLPPHHLVHCSRLPGLTAGCRGEPVRNKEQKFWSARWRKHPLSDSIVYHCC